MAKSKDATAADKAGDQATDQTPQGGSDSPRQPVQQPSSSTEYIDVKTGKPVDPNATPAVTGGTPTGSPAVEDADAGGQQRVFTQEELDRIISERLERERKHFADYDELKKDATKLKKLEEEQEREDRLLSEKLADLQARLQATEIEASERLIRSAVVSEAARMGFVDPMDAYQLVDVANLEADEDGKVYGVVEALVTLREQKPYLFGKRLPQVDPANPSRDQPQGRTDADRYQEYFAGGGGAFFRGGGLQIVEPDKPNK